MYLIIHLVDKFIICTCFDNVCRYYTSTEHSWPKHTGCVLKVSACVCSPLYDVANAMLSIQWPEELIQ